MEWSTRAPRGRHNRMVTDVPRKYAGEMEIQHNVRKNKKTRRTWVRPGETTSREPMYAALGSNHHTHAPTAYSQSWCLEDYPQRAVDFPPSCTNSAWTVRSIGEQVAIARIRARCASFQRGNDSRRQLQGGRSETSTQCQGQKERERLGDVNRDATTMGGLLDQKYQ